MRVNSLLAQVYFTHTNACTVSVSYTNIYVYPFLIGTVCTHACTCTCISFRSHCITTADSSSFHTTESISPSSCKDKMLTVYTVSHIIRTVYLIPSWYTLVHPFKLTPACTKCGLHCKLAYSVQRTEMWFITCLVSVDQCSKKEGISYQHAH